jgi:hypothetical protein
MNGTSQCSIEQADFRGWQAVYLRNGLVTLVAVPDIGGRLMGYDLGPYPYLFVDRTLAGELFTPEENAGDGSLAAWKNYGGDKTWPSPQGWERDDQWPGPPDPVLDSGRYRVEKLETLETGAIITMVSPPDERTGLRITRKATLQAGSTRVFLDLSFTNISAHPVRWSIWDVAQLRAERTLQDGHLGPEKSCVVTAPLNPHSRFERGFNVMFGQESNPQWSTDHERGLFIGRYQWEIGKVGIDSQAGWVAFSNLASGYAFAEQFEVFPYQEYPDSGATVECWTVGKGQVAGLDYEHSDIYLMETEILSPFYSFAPGETRSFRIEWGSCRCPGLVVEVSSGGCTAEKLSAETNGKWVRLKGQFGVFDPGELALAWKEAGGSTLATRPLGPAHPLQMVLLDGVYERPERAARVELHVTAVQDEQSRVLAEVNL